jgi:predicted enzyme related to lactoylglutathione lyase
MPAVDLIIFHSADVPKATKLFTTLLGTEPYADSKPYVGFKVGDMEVGLVPKSERTPSGAVAYVTVPDIKAALATLLAAGAEMAQDVTDVAYGLLVASVKDLDGTLIGLRQFPSNQQ